MKIVVDVFGCDFPVEVIKGCVDAINGNVDASLILTGDSNFINSELAKYTFDKTKMEISDAKEIITNDDVPTTAIKTKKESSLVRALDIVKDNAEVVGMISAGNTGAILTGGVLKIGRIEGVLRPAVAPLLPTRIGGDVCLIDGGSNVDCRPEYLVHFALMGISYIRAVYGIENPRVGLVSIGTEDKKGNELTKQVFTLLKQLPINFLGNMEARDALSGNYDVLVCDGFVGNVLLKGVEGVASMAMGMLKESIMSSTSAKIGALFMKKALKKLKSAMDYKSRGGAPLLGIKKIIVKAHGSSKAISIESAIKQVVRMSKGNLVESIGSELNKFGGTEKTENAD